MAALLSNEMHRVERAAPTIAAGAASTPKINCLEVENRENRGTNRAKNNETTNIGCR